MQDSTIFNMALLQSHVAMKTGRFNMADTVATSMLWKSIILRSKSVKPQICVVG